MREVFLFFAFLILVSLTCAHGKNLELLNEEETRLWLSLIEAQWQQNMSDSEVELVMSGLASEKDTVVEAAITVVVLHWITEALPKLEEGVGTSYGYSRILGKIVAEAFRSGEDLISYLRTVSIENWPKEAHENIRKKMVSIIVVEEAKALRSGKKEEPDLQGLELSRLQKMILNYSRIPDEEAINNIIGKLAIAKIAGVEQYEMIDVLNTYGKKFENIVFDKMSKTEELAAMSNYGQLLLLKSLRPCVYSGRISAENTGKLKSTTLKSLKSSSFRPVAQAADWLDKRLDGQNN